ncbi:MAG TPA: branched-chain amino acid ABC transporter permease [Clostridiaceae bacterium]|nr:branched-chain amino acid ABC transporter permease [Clostridiaceae bacterium]
MRHKLKALKAAFPHTIPVMTGYLFLGAAFGILLNSKGYHFGWAILMSFFIYAGSMQFIAVNLLTVAFNPINAFLITLIVNARHLFYGVSMLKNFKGIGRLKPYLIAGLTDETYSILCSTEPPEGIDKTWFMFFITLLNQMYWVIASAVGGLIGSLFAFDTMGIDFVMTALFVVIFINQWKAEKKHIPAITGVAVSVICLLIFGPDNFIIPSMALIVLALTVFKKNIEEGF